MPPKKGTKGGSSGGGAAAAHAAAAAVQAAAAAKAAATAAKAAAKKKGPTKPADSEFIVFTTGKEKRGQGAAAANAPSEKKNSETKAAPTAETAAAPPKPTAKQLVAGASWTGKLPVNLLSEHCQKQKWERPEYDVRKVKDGYSAFVSLSARTNAKTKTGDVTRLEPFKLPPSHVHLTVKPTALEARHVAATYGLFRVCSMKNLHMMLPPEHKSLWREFGVLKAADIKEGRAWMYEADPFTAMRERELARAAADKRREQAAKEKAEREKAAGPGMALRGSGGSGGNSGSGGNKSGGNGNGPASGGGGASTRAWNNMPKIEMGGKTRTMLEDLLRRGSVWNPYAVDMPAAARARIVDELSNRLGFRPSHVHEATALCRDREETLEWLLVHVPEDDLPRWALPESYTAGVSVASTDLRREGAIQRLAQSGYALDLCRKVYDAAGGDEGEAARALQAVLAGEAAATLTAPAAATAPGSSGDDDSDDSTSATAWEAELATLESVFGPEFSHPRPDVCEIRLADVVNAGRPVDAALQFRRTANYPADLVVTLVAPQLPAYVRLSILRKTLAYMRHDLPDEETKMYFVYDWVQQHMNDMIEHPGLLKDIAAAASASAEASDPVGGGQSASGTTKKKVRRHRPPQPIKWTPDEQSRQAWQRRQESPQMQKMLAARRRLPAWDVRAAVVDTVAGHQVTIIAGETGSGKSTQAVQFVLDDLYGRGLGSAANLVVTQPRRISALGLADRVADERCTRVGDEVGYTIRGESKTSPGRTRITFCTTGVLLRRLQGAGSRVEDVVAALADVSHVVIDEVHERSLDTDFLLSILRDVLRARPDALKLVLMSATLDAATFEQYFVQDGLSVGQVAIAGRTFPVDDLYLDDVIRATGFGIGNTPGNNAGGDDSDAVAKTIQSLGSRINYALVADTARAIDEEMTLAGEHGGILVFMPGVAEINQVCSLLNRSGAALHVLPLHAALETREQRRVFAAPPAGRRKVVVATNVAETSITIDDIVAVVDTGRVKETSYDAVTNMRKLDDTWASRAACKQRRGRAGRVRPGKCYKLYTRNLEQTQMPERPEPEMRRVPLEQLCLSVRAMGIVDVAGFLARAPTPPEVAAVDGALSLLRRMGILVAVPDGTDRLTALGRQLALIPADLRCGKLMVFGALFGCLHECVTVAAILSGRSPFVVPPSPDKRELAKAARMRFAAATAAAADGDLLTDLRAVLRWDELVRDHGGSPYSRPAKAFCDDHFLNTQTLADIASTRTQLYQSLADIGIRPAAAAASSSPNHLLLRALTAAAFSPQIARIQLPDQKFAASVSGTVAIDPEARTIRYYARDHGRVFVHPSSTLFDAQGFAGRAAFVSYFTLMATSKVFVRDLTPFNAYTLLMFSGDIELDTLGRGLIVDGWLRLRGWARIGVLVSRLRGMLDRLIARRLGSDDGGGGGGCDDGEVDDGEQDAATAEQLDRDVIKAVVKLIELDGMDN